MNLKQSLTKIVNKSSVFLQDNGSTILSVLAVGGIVLTSVLTVKSTEKAKEKLDMDKEEPSLHRGLEIVSYYIPPISAFVATSACILGANALNKRQQAMLVSSYAMLEQSFKNYRKGNIDKNGKEADEKIIKDSIITEDEECQKSLIENPNNKIILYDLMSGESVPCYEGDAYKAEYEINRMFVERGYVLVNEFWGMFNMPQNNYGKEYGWSKCSGLNWIDFHHIIIEEDDGGYPIYEIEVPIPSKLEWWEL